MNEAVLWVKVLAAYCGNETNPLLSAFRSLVNSPLSQGRTSVLTAFVKIAAGFIDKYQLI